MLNGDLRYRQRKFENEAKERLQKERRKLERERRAALEAKKRREDLEQKRREKREEEELAREQESARQEAQREHNRGVFFEATLSATLISDSAALQKGIKRWKDKVLLPPSFGNSLMEQGASKNGGLLFELKTQSGRTTHAGLLEFTAPEGTVGLPKKVVRSLWGPEGSCSGLVTVSYKRLEPGTYTRLQPAKHGFHEALGDDMRTALEGSLMEHSTLTEEDWIEVHHDGITHELQVLELQPSTAVSVVDTDMEADVGPSAEVEAAIKAEQEALKKLELERAKLEQERQRKEEERQRKEQEEIDRQARLAEERRRFADSKAASLPPEVDSNCPTPWTLCLIRMPDGSRCQRRFKLEDPVSLLFDFVDSKGAGGVDSGQYRLVTQFPRRVFESRSSSTLGEAGLAQGQEVFLVERSNA